MRTKRLLVALFVLSAIAAPTLYACIPCVDYIVSYYSDSSFCTMVQFYEKDCYDNMTAWGSGGDWRIIDIYGCGTGAHTQKCEHWNGSSWDQVTCP